MKKMVKSLAVLDRNSNISLIAPQRNSYLALANKYLFC